LCGGSALVALDAAAEFLEVPRRRRLCFVALKRYCCGRSRCLGHPEDAVALSLLSTRYLRAIRIDGEVVLVVGAAVLFQPFTLLLVPVALVASNCAHRSVPFASGSSLTRALGHSTSAVVA